MLGLKMNLPGLELFTLCAVSVAFSSRRKEQLATSFQHAFDLCTRRVRLALELRCEARDLNALPATSVIDMAPPFELS